MDIIVKPIITEKMTAQAETMNRYGFIVERTATKIQIRQAVENLYGVKVSAVNTMRYGGKLKSRYTKAGYIQGKTNAYKKAIITLNEGEVIDFYSNIQRQKVEDGCKKDETRYTGSATQGNQQF